MPRRLSFRTLLILTLLGVVLLSLMLFAALSFRIHRQSLAVINDALSRQTLQRVADRLDELVRTATEHRQLYGRLAPEGRLTSAEFPRVFQQLWATVEPHAELSFLGVGLPATGEYAMVRRHAGEGLQIRMYVKDPETGPEIRDYRPLADRLELVERIPWTNDGDPRRTYDLPTRPFYQAAVQAGRDVWTDSYLFWGGNEEGELPGVSYVTPIYDAAGKLSLVWDIDLELRSLSRFLERVQSQVPGQLLIAEQRADGAWRLLAAPSLLDPDNTADDPCHDVAERYLEQLPATFEAAERLCRDTTVVTVADQTWEVYSAVLQGPERPRWLIAELRPANLIPPPTSYADPPFWGTFLIVGLVATLAAIGVGRFIARPLQTLEQEARLLVGGERLQLPLVGGPDEIGRLSLTLNRLAEIVRQRQTNLMEVNTELRLSRERLEAHINGTPVGALEIDRRGMIVGWNPAAERIFGWSIAEAKSQRFDFIVPESIRPEIQAVVDHLIDRDGGYRNTNQNLTKDGRLIDCEWFNTPLVAPDGTTFGLACLVLDVTERNRIDAELRGLNEELEAMGRERTAALQMALRDLESFSYSVAHDLRTPLRAIHGFSQALAEDAGPELSLACRDHLTRIQGAAERMAELIDALLRLARVARQEIYRETVDLSELLGQIMTTRREAEPDRIVECRITPGLVAIGDRALLRVLLENLADNAWKYTRPKSPAVIEFVAEESPQGRWFCLRDNGIGFDARYAHKAIEPFQRLHPEGEFEGHGIGLATAARVAEKHGGTLVLEARPEGGAVCRFTLGPDENP